MKALILNGSPRPQGVVVQALRTAADTLRQAGADIEWIDAYRMEFRPCTGCMQCRTTNICPLPRDAAHAVGEQIRQADLLVVGTPTYWGGMSARLKMLFERL
ncbi:flavodoxin family protein, partial [Alistipes putredinis]